MPNSLPREFRLSFQPSAIDTWNYIENVIPSSDSPSFANGLPPRAGPCDSPADTETPVYYEADYYFYAFIFVPRSPALRRPDARSARCRQSTEAFLDHQYAMHMAALQTARHSLPRDGDVVPEAARPSAAPPHFPGEQFSPQSCEAAYR
jgi:hypothetical protein